MKKINSHELENLVTLIKEFMIDRSSNNKNFKELLAIYESCYLNFYPDLSKDLRINTYVQDMKNKKWNQEIIPEMKNGQITDGIHRGIAYLKCIKEGIYEKELPEVYLKTL